MFTNINQTDRQRTLEKQEELAIDSPEPDFEIVSWERLKSLPSKEHASEYLDILEKHGFSELVIPVPLQARYTKGRRWTSEEFEACFSAWEIGKSLTLIAANLNRNPQDIIYKLLDRCKEGELTFTQRGRTENTHNWNSRVKMCAEELFQNGLPAWKIAVIFRIEFEHLEKELFAKRKGYGHNKQNPFTINTDHKQLLNQKVIEGINKNNLKVFEPYAGEGRFTKILLEFKKIKDVTCVEKDDSAFSELIKNIDSSKATIKHVDNIVFMESCKTKFDIIDLDPFVTCHQQLDIVWRLLEDEAYLFLTFGGEYRRSFIKTNRKSIAQRYGFLNLESGNSEYLEKVPYYFLGSVAEKASRSGFEFEVIRAVRYANNCRFWLKIRRSEAASHWFKFSVIKDGYGIFYRNLEIPRFKEVRKEIDDAKKSGFNK